MTDISNCCGASINVHRGGEGTSYYLCGSCGKPCDPATPSNRIRHLEKENAELKSALKMATSALAKHLGCSDSSTCTCIPSPEEALSNPVLKKVMET